jgi:hypothetical protein
MSHQSFRYRHIAASGAAARAELVSKLIAESTAVNR